MLPPWCVKPPKIVLDLVHVMKDRTDASVYKQLFMAIRERYRDYIPVYHGMGVLWLVSFHLTPSFS